ncbi:hypothetical protein SDC9_92885 [bioreactor metagenome]|uniref:Uncharacterized protein n=1 Tax=bioreactor metagenome TaxID=1076179 RepID=A0A644ZZI4_9ZZZZ
MTGHQQREIRLQLAVGFELGAGFLIDFLFLVLPVAVEILKLSGVTVSLDDVVRFQQRQRHVGVADPPGGIDPRREFEGDVRRRKVAFELGALDQRPDAGAELFLQNVDAVLDHDPVFAQQRDDVGHRAERHIVEHVFKMGGEPAEVVFAAVFDEGVGELERRPGPGENLKVVEFGINLGIDHRQRGGQFGRRLMMVGDDGVDSHFDRLGHRVDAGDAAIDGNQQPAVAEMGQRFAQTFGGEAVAVVKAVRNERVDDRAVAAQHQRQQRTAGDAVGVVIAVDQDRFAVGDGIPDPLGGRFDSGEPIGVAQAVEPGIQKIPHLPGPNLASGKIESDRPRQPVLPDQIFHFTVYVCPSQFPFFRTHYASLSLNVTLIR